jgi:hypothetical protein
MVQRQEGDRNSQNDYELLVLVENKIELMGKEPHAV